MKNHILVTGGAGFIGSHLCDALLKKGYAITALDNFVTGQKKNLSSASASHEFQFIEKDISEPLLETEIPFIQKYGLHGILHFACPASPIDFEKIPFEILKVDSLGTIHTVDLALKHGARYVLASTSEVYGDPLEHPQKETYWGNVNTLGPRSCYDETKRFAEAYVSTAARGTGKYQGKNYTPLNGGMVRIFNTYGPRMRPDDGRVVPELCMQALSSQPLSIHGSGQQTRSFCYVDDLVRGIILYFESSIKEPVNLGNPNEFTILEFAQVLQNLTQKKSEIKFYPGREDDPKKRKPDITRAQKHFHWNPEISLEVGLKRTIEFFQNESKK